jgi:hypothetical protein
MVNNAEFLVLTNLMYMLRSNGYGQYYACKRPLVFIIFLQK